MGYKKIHETPDWILSMNEEHTYLIKDKQTGDKIKVTEDDQDEFKKIINVMRKSIKEDK